MTRLLSVLTVVCVALAVFAKPQMPVLCDARTKLTLA